MKETQRIIDALEALASELESLRDLKEHELGVRLEHSKQGAAPTCRHSRPTRSSNITARAGALSLSRAVSAPAFAVISTRAGPLSTVSSSQRLSSQCVRPVATILGHGRWVSSVAC
jgi:hypothetical protein